MARRDSAVDECVTMRNGVNLRRPDASKGATLPQFQCQDFGKDVKTMTNTIRFSTFSILVIFLAVTLSSARAATVNAAHDVAKTIVKAPVVAPPEAEDDATEAKKDDVKAKPAPTPKPKPKPRPGPRDDGDGD